MIQEAIIPTKEEANKSLDSLQGRFERKKYNDELCDIAAELSQCEQVEMPVVNRFAPGVYIRQITMPKGTTVIGQEHKTKHFNIVMKGSAEVMVDGEIELIEAGAIFTSEAGVMKSLKILEEMVWLTIHPTDETDLDKLEEMHIVKRDAKELYNKKLEKKDKLCLGD